MNVTHHVVTGLIISIILYHVFGNYVIILFASSFLFDIDHYIEYIIRKKDFSLIKAYREAKELDRKSRLYKKLLVTDILHIFHTAEFFLIIAVLSFFNKIFLMMLIGLLTHEALDLLQMAYYKAFKFRAHSLILWIIRHKGEKDKWQQRWAQFYLL